MHYRLAVPEDAPALLQIYSEYIHSTITFEYTLPTTEEFAERIRTIAGFYPYIVAEEDGRCMGYAYAHRHMERAAYQWNAELSVYLAKSAVGCGLGGGLYSRLMTLLKAQGVLSVFGCVTSPNPPSTRLHKRMGFKLVGTYLQAGLRTEHGTTSTGIRRCSVTILMTPSRRCRFQRSKKIPFWKC